MIFSRKIEPKPLTIPSFFNRSVHEYAGRPAVSFVNGTPITYAELGRQVDELARKLYALGLQPGDKVALLGHNMPNWVVAYFAATTTGLVIVPILPDFTREEVENVLSHSEAKVLLVSERLYVKVEGLALPHLQATFKLDNLALLDGSLPAGGLPPVPSVEVREDDMAALIYTSGTTGRSKGVMLSHRSITFVAMQAYHFQPLDEEDVFLSFLPLSHTYENSLGLLLPVMYGCSIYYLEKPPTAAALMPAMERIRPTVMLSVPLIMEKIFIFNAWSAEQKYRFVWNMAGMN